MKHVLITGSTRGIGFAMACSFLKTGSRVTINGTSSAGVKSALQKLTELFPKGSYQGIRGDMTSMKDVEELAGKAVKGFGEIDIWVNNAGINQKNLYTWEMKEEDIVKIIDTDLIGVMRGSVTAFNLMRKQGYGRIYNMEGLGSNDMMLPKSIIYGTSKRALRYFSRGLALEAKGSPVQVSTISPGMVVTDFLLKIEGQAPEDEKQMRRIINILADKAETVAPWLVKKMLSNRKNNACFNWLTGFKAFRRFLTAPFIKRNLA
jgi:NAD(P)-dependent dehydrogenase (short-subunit alcohol dehydrogenase family)